MVRLTILKPERAAETVTFTEPAEMTVGRSASCNYCLDFDPMVSRMHAVILVDPPSIRIKDLNSTNGLTVNGELFGALSPHKIAHPLELRDGDEVRIGGTVFRISLGDEVALGAIDINNNADAGATLPGITGTSIRDRLTSSQMIEIDSTQYVGSEETVPNVLTVLPAIPGYEVTRFLPEGQTCKVYMATSKADGRTVIVKVIAPDMTFTRKMLDDFRREASTASRVQHPNIVQMLGMGETENSGVFVAMEYVNGEDLASYLWRCPNRRIPLHNAYNLMLQLAGAVCYLHGQGLVHMDVKPSSIILYDDNGRLKVKLTDIGYSHFMDDTGIALRGLTAGEVSKLAYLPPEELTQIGEAKPSADVFSLSAVFYEILTGRVPYNFTAGGSNRKVVANADMTSIEEALPGLPEPLVVIIERGLAPDPEARYQNSCDLLEALQNVWV